MKNAPLRPVSRFRAWPRRVVIGLGIVVVLLIGARIVLPYWVERVVNQRLAAIPGYTGSVADIDMALLRGGYVINGLSIFKVQGDAREPFVAARRIEFTLAWRELLRGKVVSDIHADGAELTFVATADDETSQTDMDRRWQDVIEDLFPLEITHLQLTDGMIRYRNTTLEPKVDLFVRDLTLVATGLRNRPEETGEEFPAEVQLEGVSLGGGKLVARLQADPLARDPHFHLSVELDGVHLPDLNESLRAYANVDVGGGTFRLAAEMAGKDGGFQGYVKPFFEDLDFTNLEDREQGILSRIWERLVQGLAWLVKNKARDQVATRIPFKGRFGDPEVGLLTTIANLFRHGFVRAFNPTVEGSIDPENVLPSGDSADGRDVGETKTDPVVSQPAPVDDAGERSPKRGR